MQAQTIPSQKFHIDTQNRSCCLKEVTNFQGPSFWGIWLLVFGGAPTFCPKEFHLKVGVFFNPFQHGGSSCLQKSKHVFFCFPGGFFVIKTFSSCELDVSDVFVRGRVEQRVWAVLGTRWAAGSPNRSPSRNC